MFEFNGLLILFILSFVESINVRKSEFSIEGKLEINKDVYEGWKQETKIMINGGEFIGHLRENGTFVINGLKTGDYNVIVATNQGHDFFPVMVKIKPDGKVCAQTIVNFARELGRGCDPYPLVIRRKPGPGEVKKKPFIFETDNYMLMLLQAGAILLLVLLQTRSMPMINPIEAREEMAEEEANDGRQQRAHIINRPEMFQVEHMMENVPDVSMWLTNFFSRWFPLAPTKNQTQNRNRSRRVASTLPSGRKQKRRRF